jgi:hypothetical protein
MNRWAIFFRPKGYGSLRNATASPDDFPVVPLAEISYHS